MILNYISRSPIKYYVVVTYVVSKIAISISDLIYVAHMNCQILIAHATHPCHTHWLTNRYGTVLWTWGQEGEHTYDTTNASYQS